MNRDKHFVVELQEDVSSGELVLPIPQQFLTELGWYEGAELEWSIEGDELVLREYSK